MTTKEETIRRLLMVELKSKIKKHDLNCWVLIRGIDTFKLCDLEHSTDGSEKHYITKEFPLSTSGLFDAIREVDVEIAFHRGIAYCIKEKLVMIEGRVVNK